MPEEKRLLILDDEVLTAQTIKAIAEFARYTVEVCTRPGDFFNKLESWHPDVIALDLIMPEMDGVEVMTELAKRSCRSRIIITSGVGNRVLDAAGRSASEHGLNISGILAKPFTPSSLRALLDLPGHGEFVPAESDAHGGLGEKINAARLQRAIENGELFVCYQPKVTCQSGVLSGFEALVRWKHPRLGVIAPASFIPLAEEEGLIDALTIEVLNQSLHWLRDICEEQGETAPHQDLSKLSLSINLSAASLNNMAIFDHLNELCRELGISPQRLIFELTETSAMEDPMTSLDLLTRLRMKGFRLSIDDFGTGFSSMLQLVRLPFSEIKVDKSFVATARDSAESRAVIRSIVELGHSLALQVTAEGIEDEESLSYLRNLGCDLAQGYFIARPMTGAQVPDWLAQREPSNEQRRLAALRALDLLDTEQEERYDRLTQLGQRLFNLPMAAITLIDSDRAWMKSRQGISVNELPREEAFCSLTIEKEGVNIVTDAHENPSFSGLAMVNEAPNLRFYAGCPIHASDGSRIGAFCLMDYRPRQFSEREVEALQELTKLVEKELYSGQWNIRDTDTGALNIQGFDARAKNALAVCARLNLTSALLLVEVRSLESRNEVEVAKRNNYKIGEICRLLEAALRDSDLVGRLGHDKFIALLIGAREKDKDDALARLAKEVRRYNQSTIEGLELQYKAGSAVLDRSENDNLQSLLAKAELDMYR